jgi:flavin-dependent dehydrogenase
MTTSFDLLVIGGGPAGPPAAARGPERRALGSRQAAPAQGLRQFVSETGVDVWRRAGRGTEGLPRLTSAAFRNVDDPPAREGKGPRVAHFPLEPAAYGITREVLDGALLDACRARGIAVWFEARAGRPERRAGAWHVGVRGGPGELTASRVVTAVGRRPVVDESAGWFGMKGETTARPTGADVEIVLLPDGSYYGLCAVNDDQVSLCALSREDRAPWVADPARSGDTVTPFRGTPRFSTGMQAPPAAGLFAVGDALAAWPPLVGDGITSALLGGILLGNSLGVDEALTPQAWRRRWEAHYGKALRRSLALHAVLRRPALRGNLTLAAGRPVVAGRRGAPRNARCASVACLPAWAPRGHDPGGSTVLLLRGVRSFRLLAAAGLPRDARALRGHPRHRTLPPNWHGSRDMPALVERTAQRSAELAPRMAPTPGCRARRRTSTRCRTALSSVDGELLYALLRRLKPRRVIEVGSGNSTLLTAQALRENAAEAPGAPPPEFTAYEPWPGARLRAGVPGLTRLAPLRAQEIPPEAFAALGANDVLFIDSSHVVQVGGDVTHLFFQVLPRLAPGVVVHLHDIFLPRSIHGLGDGTARFVSSSTCGRSCSSTGNSGPFVGGLALRNTRRRWRRPSRLGRGAKPTGQFWMRRVAGVKRLGDHRPRFETPAPDPEAGNARNKILGRRSSLWRSAPRILSGDDACCPEMKASVTVLLEMQRRPLRAARPAGTALREWNRRSPCRSRGTPGWRV